MQVEFAILHEQLSGPAKPAEYWPLLLTQAKQRMAFQNVSFL